MKKKSLLAMGLLSAMLFTGCGDLVSEPLEGDSAATYLNNSALTEEQQLLVTGKATAAETTLPSLLGFTTNLNVNGMAVDNFYRQDEIHFGSGSEYTTVEGVITFRGNNYRSTAAFGNVNISKKTLEVLWEIETGSLKKTVKKGEWTGSGWTGQPLLVRWDEATKQKMKSLYESKRNKSNLVEVIYATMDGHIYFLDLEDGSPTRDKINLGYPIKGTGSLYPDGTPLYVVGAGDDQEESARTFIVDLIGGSIIYEYGYDDEFALRTDNGAFCAFDSSPLFDVDTQTLIQPGENGVLYTMKLNMAVTDSKITVNPTDIVKWNYETDRTGTDTYWLGMESSAVTYDHYIYIANNSGDLMCIDLNTMELVWSQDIVDDSNASPVLDVDTSTGTAYIYISTSLHWTQSKKAAGDIPIFKINAATGEIIWKRSYSCKTVDGVSGGVQATAALGENNVKDLVYFNIARTGGKKSGKIVAIDKKTGGEAWSVELKYYSWSSPVLVYDQKGDGYLIVCESGGNMHLLNARTGELLSTVDLGDNIEASPAVFNNTIVVGTRGKKIYGITIK